MSKELKFNISLECSTTLGESGLKTIIDTVRNTDLNEFDLEVPEEAKGHKYLSEMKPLLDTPEKLVEVFMGRFLHEEFIKMLKNSKDDLDDDDHFCIEYGDVEIKQVGVSNV